MPVLNTHSRAILSLLAETEMELPPSVIYHNLVSNGTDISKRTVHRRIQTLVGDEYVECTDPRRGYYRATKLGEVVMQ